MGTLKCFQRRWLQDTFRGGNIVAVFYVYGGIPPPDCENIAAVLMGMVAFLILIWEHCGFLFVNGCRMSLNVGTTNLNMTACLHVKKKICNHAIVFGVHVPG